MGVIINGLRQGLAYKERGHATPIVIVETAK